MITVRKHKGRSGKSAFEWRVYRVTEVNPGRTVTTQLGKYRTQEAADQAAEHYRDPVPFDFVTVSNPYVKVVS